MRPDAKRSWLSPVALMCLISLTAVLTNCTVVTGTYSSDVADFEAEKVESHDRAYYMAQLADLPLRFDTISSIRLANPGSQPVALREAHLLRDTSNKSGDTLVAVFDDRRFTTVNVRDMTLGVTSELVKRTRWAPVLTNDFIVFVDQDGVRQEFYRASNSGGVLREHSEYGLGMRPSTQVAGIGNYVIMPTSNRNTLQGFSTSGDQWQFPDLASKSNTGFRMVQVPPAADSESIYVVSNNNYLYSIDANSGEVRFEEPISRVGRVLTQPVIANDLIFVGTDTGELLGFDRSGKIVISHNMGVDGPIWGSIYAIDDWVFYHVGTRDYERSGGDDLHALHAGRTTQDSGSVKITTAPDRLVAVKIDRRQPRVLTERGASRDRGEADEFATDEDGNPVYDVDVLLSPREAAWTLPDDGNVRVLMKTEKYVYVLHEEWTVPYTSRQRQRLWEEGRVVRDEELRVYSKRVLQVLDLKTGEVVKVGDQEYSWELPSEIEAVIGSMDASDRAIYFVTRDGYLFKGFAQE